MSGAINALRTMKQLVLKYEIPITDYPVVQWHKGGKILSVQEQYGKMVAWVLVNPRQPIVEHRLAIIGTGNPVPDDVWGRGYIASVQMHPFVWHLFHRADAA